VSVRMMRLIGVIALLAGAWLTTAQAQPAPTSEWEAGKHYFVIDPVVATSSGDKIEVTEVFSYGCPGCNASYTFVDKVKKDLPANAAMNYVPASFHPEEDWVVFQRAFFAAKTLGILDKTHDATFDAVWKSGELAVRDAATNRFKSPLPTIEDVAKFYTKFGVKAEDFVAAANSFTISTRMKQADAYIKAAGVDQTPTIIVNGKYRLTVQSAGGDWTKAEQLILFLIHKESGAK
jgi:thiol:disulfide interchange protein DsbA